MSDCKMCGSCCKAIGIGSSREELLAYQWGVNESFDFFLEKPEYGHDVHFILKYWEPITRDEAIKINPLLKRWPAYIHFYRCTLFKDNKCSMHKDRPRTCKGFPRYGKPRKEVLNYSKDCGYLERVKEEKKYLNPYFKGVKLTGMELME
jgi:Fe-S-cluster containining protein